MDRRTEIFLKGNSRLDRLAQGSTESESGDRFPIAHMPIDRSRRQRCIRRSRIVYQGAAEVGSEVDDE